MFVVTGTPVRRTSSEDRIKGCCTANKRKARSLTFRAWALRQRETCFFCFKTFRLSAVYQPFECHFLRFILHICWNPLRSYECGTKHTDYDQDFCSYKRGTGEGLEVTMNNSWSFFISVKYNIIAIYNSAYNSF